MNNEDATTASQQSRLAAFDRDLQQWLATPSESVSSHLAALRRRLRWQRRARIAMPLLAFLLAAVLVAPWLWQATVVVVDMLPGTAGLGGWQPDMQSLLTLVQQLPSYAWALMLGVAVSLIATFAES
ncbi:MAG: hypothetical protein AAF270_10540 [Pseudomonadota bacterium]